MQQLPTATRPVVIYASPATREKIKRLATLLECNMNEALAHAVDYMLEAGGIDNVVPPTDKVETVLDKPGELTTPHLKEVPVVPPVPIQPVRVATTPEHTLAYLMAQRRRQT